jgi:hypothetical protein
MGGGVVGINRERKIKKWFYNSDQGASVSEERYYSMCTVIS